jgi:hypothetical protein
MNTTPQKATYDPNRKSKFTTSHRKEGKCFFDSYSIITTDDPYENRDGGREAREPITLRLYGTGAKHFACLWINHASAFNTSGSGSAGGYGYHRQSSAAEEAITNAGFKLSKPIGGVGNEAIKEALCAIAEEIGLKNYYIVKSHA